MDILKHTLTVVKTLVRMILIRVGYLDKLLLFAEEWTEWSQIEPCTIDHYEASDNSSFYSTWQRTCTGGQCKLQLEEKLVLCEPINGNWSAWQDANDTECFETVHGNWIKLIYRTCSNPEPVNGGSCQEDQEGNGTKAILCTPGKFYFKTSFFFKSFLSLWRLEQLDFGK